MSKYSFTIYTTNTNTRNLGAANAMQLEMNGNESRPLAGGDELC